MNRHVDAIAGRLSLRPPQRRSLEILHRVTELAPPGKDAGLAAALASIRDEFPGVTDFERTFPSLCFSLATGVGKTRLMGAFIAYLHIARGINNFFVLAPNLTVYDKLITDFTPNTPKYVLDGLSEFAITPPFITTGESYRRQIADGRGLSATTINIFNIAKINAEVRGGRSPRIRSFREEIGDSYFDHLAGLPDLVLIMDESHRYRASAGIRAINGLKPVLGLELTATPFVEGPRGPVPFRNVIFDYPLAAALADGFVKEPAVVTRENFVATGLAPEVVEDIKLTDGIRLHEGVKVELATYARQTGERLVKPFMLVVARDTAHAATLMRRIGSEAFFGGRYAGKVIQVDSSVKEDETIARLLRVEQSDEPTEIVIHVNMLKEGWDVSNLYTIVPLRAANARTLLEQTLGRGLRLPYGRRTGVAAVDRLNVVAHDRFQEIVDEARRPGSPIRLAQVVLPEGSGERMVTVVSQPHLASKLGIPAEGAAHGGFHEAPALFDADDGKVARIAYGVIRGLETQPERLPGVAFLRKPEMQAEILRAVESQYRPPQTGLAEALDMAAIVARTTELVVQQTIDIPRILVVPKGVVKSGFRPFTLDLSRLRYEAPTETLWAAHLRTGQVDRLGIEGAGTMEDERLEDHVVGGLVDFDDVAYEEHAELLYDLAGQVTAHLLSSLSGDDVRRVLRLHRREIAGFVHAQMRDHFWQDSSVEYEVKVTRGFVALKPSAYTAVLGEPPLDFRSAPADKSNMSRYLFGGFSRCLYPVQKFQSDPERKLAVILEREALKWFKPARGQFPLSYRRGGEDLGYQPDFVAETQTRKFMLEPKAADQMHDPDVLAKRDAATAWCRLATADAAEKGGKPWSYLLIPHDAIAENMTIEGLASAYGARG